MQHVVGVFRYSLNTPCKRAWSALGMLLVLVSTLRAGTGTITIDESKPGPAINPHLYGIFLEEINGSVDGGLYAELIANRAFEDSRPPDGCEFKDGHWLSKKGWDSGFRVREGEVPHWSLQSGGMSLETSGGINTNSPYCLRLDGKARVANDGYWGIGIKEGAVYNLSLFARGTGSLRVHLEDAAGHSVSETAVIQGLDSGWKQFHATLTGTKSAADGRLVIENGSAAPVWLDFVSLMPRETWRNLGLRPDLAEMVADLKPGFVRWPGGCVAEGGNIESAYHWKQSIGPVTDRRQAWSAWNHPRTHGLGFLEWLEFCESIGAEPLWVNFAGMSCLFRHADVVPMDRMDRVVADFLDGVEFANGPMDSTWGALRAKAGHPKPFHLGLIEISNESGTPDFPPRYRLVQEALRARYPGIKAIADFSWINHDLMKGCQYDIEDNHIYTSPHWFLSNQHLYDKRDRSLAPLYLGEVAVTSPDGGPLKGNMIAALSEGAFMMGCERNGDTVNMISYAPLISHVKRPNGWHGMIYHDSTRCFGTVSYYLWKLFGANRPGHTVAAESDVSFAHQGTIKGSIGLGTWDTAAEFKEIRLEKDGKPLSLGDWHDDGGHWSAGDGGRTQTNRGVAISYAGDASWSDYTLSLKARKIEGDEGFLIVFGRKDGMKYWWNLGGWGNRLHSLEFNRTPVGQRVPGNIEQGRWYDIRIELTGNRIRCYLDGKLIHDVMAPETRHFAVNAGRDAQTGELIIKAINTSDESIVAKLNVTGEGTCTVLKADRPDDNNSLDDPRRIVPSTAPVRVDGTHEFPPRSLSVLRLTTKTNR